MNAGKFAAAFVLTAAIALSPMQPCICVSAESKTGAVYCDIRGYEDFYYFPVKCCDGKKYNFYVYNFGSGCGFNLDTADIEQPMMGFQYSSVLSENMPAKEYKDISSEKAADYLKKYDFRVMRPDTWYDDTYYEGLDFSEETALKRKKKEDYANKCISVLENLELTGKFGGYPEELSPAPYNETKAELDIAVTEYVLYTDISAEFYVHNGKTVVKLSGTDFTALSDIAAANKKTVPSFDEVSRAYKDSSRFEGYFYCDPAPLEKYFGRTGEEPSVKAKRYYKEEYTAEKPFPKEKLNGKKLSDFIDAGDFKPKDSEYSVCGNAAACPPDDIKELSVRYNYSHSISWYNYSADHIYGISEINKEKAAEIPDNVDLRFKLTGTLFGNKCRYYEYFFRGSYNAELIFEIDGKYYIASVKVYNSAWDTDFRRLFTGFFGSIKPASELESIKFGKAPSDCFKDYDISEKEYTAICGGMKLYIPKSLKYTDKSDDYFYAMNEKDKYSMSVSVLYYDSGADGFYNGYRQNCHRKAYHTARGEDSYIESDLKHIYHFKRGGAYCTLAVKETMNFVSGRETVYEYNIERGDDYYAVYVTLPEKSKNTAEDAFKVLSSIK